MRNLSGHMFSVYLTQPKTFRLRKGISTRGSWNTQRRFARVTIKATVRGVQIQSHRI